MGQQAGIPTGYLDANYWKIDQTTPQTAVGTHIFPAVKTDHIGEKTSTHSIVADNDISISAGKKLIFLAS